MITGLPGIINNPIVRSMLFWLTATGLLFLAGATVMAFIPMKYTNFSNGIIGSLVAFFSTWIFLQVDQRRFRQIGLAWEYFTLYRFIYGVLIGMVILGILFISLLSFTELQASRNPKGVTIGTLIGYLAFMPLALMEELTFRSYSFVIMNKKYGMWVAQIVTAIAFAVYHMLVGWSLVSAFTGPFVWAFVFGLAAAWSGGIALPTGLHFMVNVLQNYLGMRGIEHSLFTLSYKDGLDQRLIDKTETVGLIIQGSVLIIAVVTTAWYIRKKSK